MQAIRTRFHGPTNIKGPRISAKCAAGSITLGWDYALNSEENHKRACDALLLKLGWLTPHYRPMVGGEFEGDHYWVFLPLHIKG